MLCFTDFSAKLNTVKKLNVLMCPVLRKKYMLKYWVLSSIKSKIFHKKPHKVLGIKLTNDLHECVNNVDNCTKVELEVKQGVKARDLFLSPHSSQKKTKRPEGEIKTDIF